MGLHKSFAFCALLGLWLVSVESLAELPPIDDLILCDTEVRLHAAGNSGNDSDDADSDDNHQTCASTFGAGEPIHVAWSYPLAEMERDLSYSFAITHIVGFSGLIELPFLELVLDGRSVKVTARLNTLQKLIGWEVCTDSQCRFVPESGQNRPEIPLVDVLVTPASILTSISMNKQSILANRITVFSESGRKIYESTVDKALYTYGLVSPIWIGEDSLLVIGRTIL